MLIGNIPLRDLTAHDVRRALNKLAALPPAVVTAPCPVLSCPDRGRGFIRFG